ncbi:membrane hypothetical protein [Candidatus Zixiibacteriota bacterium]|nr:membrane hypothetical protein [candidate division Zixibacteria bacterium]
MRGKSRFVKSPKFSTGPFWVPYLILSGLFALQFLPLLFPRSRLWAFNSLIFLPPAYLVACILLAAVALIAPFLTFMAPFNSRLKSWFQQVFFESPRKYLYRLLFVGVSVTLFITLSAKTHFLGDGYALLGNLASQTGEFVKWSERGVTIILITVRSLLGGPSADTALNSFRMVSYLSGAVSLWFIFALTGLISSGDRYHIMVFSALLFTGMLLLFFGYVENYPLVWIGLTGFSFFAIKYLRTGKGIVLSGTFLLFGIFMHLEMGIFVPAYLFLLFIRGAGNRFYKRFPYLVWIFVCTLIILALYIFRHKYSTSVYFQNFFLPLFTGKPQDPAYAVFSWPHIIDMLNQLFLLFPLLLILLPFASRGWKRLLKSSEGLFLTLMALGGVAFLSIIDPTLGMPRDWDLFSITAFGLILLVVLAIPDKKEIIPVRFIFPLLMFSVMISGLNIAKNINVNSSLAYTRYFARLDTPKSLSTLMAMHGYFKNNSDTAAVADLHLEFSDIFQSEQKMERAVKAGDNGDFKSLRALLDSIPPDNYSSRYHLILSQKMAFEGQLQLSLQELNKAIQLQEYNFNLYTRRSMIYAILNKYPEALTDLQMAYRLNNSNMALLEGLAIMQLECNRPDSALYYTELLEKQGPTGTLLFYIRARAGSLLGNEQLAKINAHLYIDKALTDPKYPVRKKEMEQILRLP